MISKRDGCHKKAWLIAVNFLMILASSVSMSAPTAKVGLSAGLEAFRLKEFDSGGTRLLKESGTRYVTTVFLDDGGTYAVQGALLYRLEASAYWGQVDYDGISQSVDATQNNLALRSKTDYLGGHAEIILGYRFRPANGPRSLEAMGGLGAASWNRSIRNATAANGTPVSGIEENYNVYYGKIALGLNDFLPSSWRNHVQFGVKLPFRINEDVKLSKVGYDDDLTLQPGNTYSGFVKLLLEPRPKDDKSGNLLISVYYDGLRLNPSKAKTVTRNGSPVQVWQPESHMDIFGLQLGYRF